ncbi:MAG TPA: hypothetical protein IAA45_09710 [Candidatus Blautia gallistercoris]|uniref:Uncharacterized protein n=1 Tax=Candidatus Blautia gallistercoris TaxID=2838490 RepID=A0A9D1WKT5_9FIRM|nr:hypothetical protein [Candidatus Blautia gallistercoris]
MAKRYRYSFAKLKPSPRAVWSVSMAIASVALFLISIVIAFLTKGEIPGIIGGVCLFAMLISIYGFIQGLRSFGDKKCSHSFSTAGAIANGIIMIGWLGVFLLGV